jgi:tryptophan 2,3-dioxygenase
MSGRNKSEHARALRAALAAPIFNRIIKKWVGKGELDYEVYLKTQDLYALQAPHHAQVTAEELMFQIVHQTQELWLKLVASECADLIDDLDADAFWQAAERLERIVRVQRGMAEEMRVLMTLTPDVYQVIRRHLGNGSGQESPGYNQVHLAAQALTLALERLLARRALTLVEVYREGATALDVRRLCEQLADFDEAFQSWLTQHFMLVRRTIGIDREVRALDGVPTTALPARMLQPLFSALWDVRVQLTRSWKREGGTAPGMPRPPVERRTGPNSVQAPVKAQDNP